MPLSAPKPKKACVMGWPISHSLSPKMHTYWLNKYGIDGSYEAKPVTPATLQDALANLIDNGYAGCNLTAPLKEEAMPLMDSHDASALAVGAVNTVVIKDGKLKGYNSDGFGFIESLKSEQPQWSGDNVVVIGAGGAARGIIAALKANGARKFNLVCRTPSRAENIIESLKVEGNVLDWTQREKALVDASLLVNTSCLGMDGEDELELGLDNLPPTAIVSDIIYHPMVTPLLQHAQDRGNPTVEGIGMLIHQGRLGFNQWFGRDPEVTDELYCYMKEQCE